MYASVDQLPGRLPTPLPQPMETRPLRPARILSPQEAAPAADAADSLVLPSLLRRHRLSLCVRYALIVVENLLRIAQPLVLGWAINDLLASSYHGLMIFAGQHLGYVLVGSLRQFYETRFLRDISADATTQALEQARISGERSAWMEHLIRLREAIEIEMDAGPQLIHIAFSLVGALLMLGWYDITLVPLCVVHFVPAGLLNAAYGRKSLLVSRRLQVEHKRELAVTASGSMGDVRRHFEAVTHWRSKLADSEATNFCLMELFVLGLLAAALVHYCLNTAPQAGDVFAVFQYVLLFITALGGIPLAVRKIPASGGC